jgi:hypothetical protein
VLKLIAKRLSLNDYLALRAVCRSCRKTISNIIENNHCFYLPEMPQVFLPSKDSRFFFSLSKKSVHHHHRTPPLKCTNICVGSVEGWLIMRDDYGKGFENFFFLNPVTDVRIMIPSKLSLVCNSSVQDDIIQYVIKMVASSKPNCDRSSDCYLAGLFYDFCHIAIYKLFDKSWTIVESDKNSGTYFTDVEIIGTKLYVSNLCSDSLLIYCLKDFINGPPKAKVLAKFPDEIFTNYNFCYLSKDEAQRELYIILGFCNIKPDEIRHVIANHFNMVPAFVEPPQFTKFKLFKLDTNKDPIGCQNVQLKDRVVFISNLKSMVMSRDELNFDNDLIRGNSIYFAFYFPCPTNPWSGLKLGMFDLTDSSIKYFPVETSKDGDVPYPIWFVPSLC